MTYKLFLELAIAYSPTINDITHLVYCYTALRLGMLLI